MPGKDFGMTYDSQDVLVTDGRKIDVRPKDIGFPKSVLETTDKGEDNWKHQSDNMEAYKLRVLMEAKELNERLGRLKAFFDIYAFAGLGIDEQNRMGRQVKAMTEYLDILNERIGAF